jgi:feruloyl esterase
MTTQLAIPITLAAAFFGSMALAPTLAQGKEESGLSQPVLPTCTGLLTLAPLAGNPAVYSATATPQITPAPNSRMYCLVNVVWRDPREVGTPKGYADTGPPTVDAYQTIRLAIALPLNTNTGDSAWGGRVIMTAGGGSQGSVPDLSDMVNMTPAEVGGGSDSGHGDANSGSGDTWGVIQGQRLNYGKIKDWAGGRSNGITVKLAKELARVYYGQRPSHTYWNACSGGGHMGWAQVEFYPAEYDGALIGAPAHNWQEFRLADSWDALARQKVAQKTTPITQAQLDAVNAAANASCAATDGVTVNGAPIMNDPRGCTWSATNYICGNKGAPAAPLCLNSIQAAGIDQGWDGPRNRYGKRIWGPYDRGINHGSGTATASSTVQVMTYNHFDNNFAGNNLYLDQESLNLAAAAGTNVSQAITYENEAVRGSVRTADYIDDNEPDMLQTAQKRGMKIMVYHGMQDPLIQFRNDIDFYIRVASQFAQRTGDFEEEEGGDYSQGANPDFRQGPSPDFGSLLPWYRLFLVPNAGHCPSVPNALPALINWVENGVAPDSLVEPAVSQAAVAGPPGSPPLPGGGGFGGPTTTIPLLCPFPQKAKYIGGSTTDASSYTCGGNLQTKAVICDGLRTVYKHENANKLQAYGLYNPALCGNNSPLPGSEPQGQ